jgi:hypothetical protein
LNQFAFADTGAIDSLGVPGRAIFDEFGPERIEAALSGFRRMNGAALGSEEVALAGGRLSKTEQIAVAYDVFRFKIGFRHAEETRGTGEVVLGEINEATLAAAFGAAGLARETERAHLERF